MFTILGGDGKEYGPVTAEQIRSWITAGRANLDTQAKFAGASEWKRLGDIPEFTGENLPPPLAPGGFSPISSVSPAGTASVAGGEPSDRGVRLLSILIDRLIAFVCALPGLALLGMEFFRLMLAVSRGQQPDFNNLNTGRLLLGLSLLCLAMLSLFIVQVVMITTRGQSIGKRIMGIRIVRFGDGGPAGFVHGWLLRAFVPGIIGAIPWIGIIFVLVDICFIFREDRRCIHDLMADTRVVKV